MANDRAAATCGVAAASFGLGARLAAARRLGLGWFRDTRGSDLLEYALLTAAIGLVGLAVLNGVTATIGRAYGATTTSVNGLWRSPAPSGP